MDYTVPADHRGKLTESQKSDKFHDLTIELKKNIEYESDGDTNFNIVRSVQSQKIWDRDWRTWK